AETVDDRNDRFAEATFGPGDAGAALRFDRIAVDILAGEAGARGDQVGADALRREIGAIGDQRIAAPGATARPHRHARHRLNAAADDQIGLAGHDFGRSRVDGFQTRGAKAVELHTRHRFVVAAVDRRRAGDVVALLVDRTDN